MTAHVPFPIGTPGLPWGEAEVATWLSRQTIKRSYEKDVLRVIDTLSSRYDVVQYGHLDYDPDKYPLFALKSHGWRESLPCALVTGGVHGYETSGVHGALRFIDNYAASYEGRVNLIIAPCVSPWGLRSDSPLEHARSRSESLISREQPGAGIGSTHASDRALPRSRARAYRFA
jgi:hypothetical protein